MKSFVPVMPIWSPACRNSRGDSLEVVSQPSRMARDQRPVSKTRRSGARRRRTGSGPRGSRPGRGREPSSATARPRLRPGARGRRSAGSGTARPGSGRFWTCSGSTTGPLPARASDGCESCPPRTGPRPRSPRTEPPPMTITSKGRASGRPPMGSLLPSASSRPLQTYRPSTSLVKSVNSAVLAVMVLLDTPRDRPVGSAVIRAAAGSGRYSKLSAQDSIEVDGDRGRDHPNQPSAEAEGTADALRPSKMPKSSPCPRRPPSRTATTSAGRRPARDRAVTPRRRARSPCEPATGVGVCGGH